MRHFVREHFAIPTKFSNNLFCRCRELKILVVVLRSQYTAGLRVQYGLSSFFVALAGPKLTSVRMQQKDNNLRPLQPYTRATSL